MLHNAYSTSSPLYDDERTKYVNQSASIDPGKDIIEIGDVNASTTTFQQDAPAAVAKFPDSKEINHDLIIPQVVTPVQDIKEFLRRPIILRQGTITTAMSGQFVALDLPREMLENVLYRDKVAGFLNFRAKTIITLQVNANRFVQGRIIMHFLPQAQVQGMYPANRNLTLTQKTSQPHVQMDIATQTEATIEIPWVSPKLYFDMTTGNGPLGGVYISMYSPMLKGTGAGDPDYTVWGHYEDVELEIPTFTPFYTQGGFKSKTKNTSDKEKDALQVTTMGAGSLIQSAKKTIGLAVPLLASLAGVPTWATDIIAGVAKSYGFSNPRLLNAPSLYRQQIGMYLSQCDRGEDSDILAFTGDNKVEVLDGFGGTGEDEASIGCIAAKFAYFGKFSWGFDNTTGQLMNTIPISTFTFTGDEYSFTDGTSIWYYYTHTPISGFMNYFRYWRGSINLKFIIVKTEFHTGRLSISYNPSPNNIAPTAPTLVQTDYLLRDVIDLKVGNEIILNIPYTNNSPYTHLEERTGTVYVHVLNPLNGPDTVPSTVDILMEVAAGPDFEVGGWQPRYEQYFMVPLVVNNNFFGTQSGFSNQGDLGQQTISAIGNTEMCAPNLASARFCMGERVSSVYQIIKRKSWCERYAVELPVPTNKSMRIRPFMPSGMGRGQFNSFFNISNILGDDFSLFTMLFAYSRGSAGVKLVTETGTAFRSSLVFEDRVDVNVFETVTIPSNLLRTAVTYSTVASNGGAEISIPHMHELHSRLNRLSVQSQATVGYGPYRDEYMSAYALDISATSAITNYAIYRFAGDDYQLGLFLGWPPTYSRKAPPS
jgi:hypothetical protein